jgi:hypothetical protein
MNEHGTIAWSELMTIKVEGAKSFYAKTVGVTSDAFPDASSGYHVAMAGGKPAWGLMDMTGHEMPGSKPVWFTSMAADDVDSRLKLLLDEAGAVWKEPFDIPQVGRIAIVRDATGAELG